MADLVWVPFAASSKDDNFPVPSPINLRGRFLFDRRKGQRWRILPANHPNGPNVQWLVEVALTPRDFFEYTLLYVDE